MFIHLEPDILECEVKWALGSYPERGSEVLTHLSDLKLEVDTADSKFLKNNSGKHPIAPVMWLLEDMETFIKNNQSKANQ